MKTLNLTLKFETSCKAIVIAAGFLLCDGLAFAQQPNKEVIDAIIKEGTNNTQLEKLTHELVDGIGPRLTGSPQMKKASDWLIDKYASWGIISRVEKWGTWRGWERGITHIDMVSPWVKTLDGVQLPWSPGTGNKPATAQTVVIPDLADSNAFKMWLPSVKGKFVLIAFNQPTGRDEASWKTFGIPLSYAKMLKKRDSLQRAFSLRLRRTGLNTTTLPLALEKAGALAIITNNWSTMPGVERISSGYTKKIPTINMSLEDYTMVYRLTDSGTPPTLKIYSESKELGKVPVFNTIAEIKGTEKPNEYVILSAHLDSWDGGTGATDNGTGTVIMMEAMRILKKVYPNPKRTILAGHWGAEEQGILGSRAFIEDHPEISTGIQAVFNQDNGTGHINSLAGQGFAEAKDFLPRWIAAAPDTIKKRVKLTFPSQPNGGSSDFGSFVAAGIPAYSLTSIIGDYFNNTHHTNRDTYDKIIFDEVRNNALLTAILAYMASEDPVKMNNTKTPGLPWPKPAKAIREGGF